MMWDLYNENILPKVIAIHTDLIARILIISYNGESFIVSYDKFELGDTLPAIGISIKFSDYKKGNYL